MSDQAMFARIRATDGDGVPVSGALAYFYASGTTSPIAVYADEAATTLLDNPVVADASGAFPQVFLSVTAKCVVKTADGAALYTVDPVATSKTTAQGAADVSFSPSASIPVTDAQAAIEEVNGNIAASITTFSATLGAAATKGFLDEDDFASNSATAAPSQQSTKAYINTAIPTKLNASGSAPIYACRAWVNFNGTGTPAIRAAGNVSSITDNGLGDYTINFSTAMPDANYAVTVSQGTAVDFSETISAMAASSVRVCVGKRYGAEYSDQSIVSVAVFR